MVMTRFRNCTRRSRRSRLRNWLSIFAMGAGGMIAFSGPLKAQTSPTPQAQPPMVKPPPVPTGVTLLPQGPPPTGLQAPLPAPAQPPPTASKPLLASPSLEAFRNLLQDRPLTINDAIAIAFATNRSFASAVEALQSARGRTGETRAGLNPTAGIGADITYFDAATTANLSALGGGGSSQKSTPPLVIVNQFNPTVTASIGMPIDISGALKAAVSQAKFQEVAARIDVNRVRNQLVLDVKNAFYNVLRAQAQAAVATDTLNNTLSRLNSAQKNYAAGTSPRFDVITATTDVANAQQGLIQAQSQVSLALALLKNTLGVNQRSPLRVTDQGAVETPPGVAPPAVPAPTGRPSGPSGSGLQQTPPPVVTPPPAAAPNIDPNQILPKGPDGKPLIPAPPSPSLVQDPIPLGGDFDALVQEALQTRPEILEADARIAAAQRGIQIARRSILPSFSLSVGYTLTPNAAGFSRFNQVAGTLGVSIPLFDGGLARARVEQARADAASAETDRRQSVDQVTLQVQQAYLILLQARDRVAVANVGLAQAHEAARLAQVRYSAGVSQQAGVSPILELSNAQTSLSQAEANQVNALYDYNFARTQLDQAIGRYSYVGVAPGYPSPPPSEVTTGAKSKR